MKLRLVLVLILGIALVSTLSGCASVYTHIYRADPNTYYITRTKQGFFSTYGTLYRCQPMQNADLSCVEIDTP